MKNLEILTVWGVAFWYSLLPIVNVFPGTKTSTLPSFAFTYSPAESTKEIPAGKGSVGRSSPGRTSYQSGPVGPGGGAGGRGPAGAGGGGGGAGFGRGHAATATPPARRT